MNNPQQAMGIPQPPQPGFGGPLAPGAPPRKRHTGLIVLILVVLLVALGGAAAVGFFVFKLGNSTASTPTCALSGYTAFTSPDHSFCLVYPNGWQVASALKGSGAQLSGPAHQVFTVANIGAFSATLQDYDIGFCNSLGGKSSEMVSVTIQGQAWTQIHCATDAGNGRVIIEAVIYKGSLYHMSYGSPVASFQSDLSQFFTPMEQSFRFI